MQNLTEKNGKIDGYAVYALALLMFVYIMNFLDRQIIYILFPLIKQETAFTDTQLAVLGGTSFAIFYTFLGIPFGRLADRVSRTKMIAAGLLTWSIFSGLTGFAEGFWSLFFCRLMVGVGEATLGPAAISLLADYFPPSKRATVTSIYSMGIAVGAGLAAIFGGYLSSIGWREAFYIVGFPGAIFAIAVYFLREPKRNPAYQETSSQINTDESIAPMTFTEKFMNLIHSVIELLKIKSFLCLCLGYALLGLATNNFSIWGATYINRIYQIPLPTIGYWAGILTLAAGIPATLFGGMFADRFRRLNLGGRMLYGALLSAVSFILWLTILFTDNFSLIIGSAFVLLFAALAWLGAAAADAIEIAGPSRRGLAVAVYFFSVNIAAYLIGSNLIGFLSDRLGAPTNPPMMRYALLVCPISCLGAAVFLIIGSRFANNREYR